MQIVDEKWHSPQPHICTYVVEFDEIDSVLRAKEIATHRAELFMRGKGFKHSITEAAEYSEAVYVRYRKPSVIDIMEESL